MDKVLIISYFFPPCNLTASQRLDNWVKYLPENDIKPIVVTRFWEGNELTEYQQLKSKGFEVIHKKEKNHEVFYLPYNQSIRDYFFIKGEHSSFFKFISKIFTFFTIILQNHFVRLIPFYNLYSFTNTYLNNNKDIKKVIISVSPFEQLFFGYLLKKKHPHIDWYADYRDDWNTTELEENKLKWYNSYFEKKWLSNSKNIISVSEYYTSKIERFVGKKGYTIYNGFDDFIQNNHPEINDEFNIVYNGTLYPTQEIEIFIAGFISFIEMNKKRKIHLFFPGLSINKSQEERVIKLLKGYEDFYTITNRLPKNEVLEIQKKASLLLMVSHKNIKGIPSSKIFEYLSLRKPFIVCPSDNDVLEKIAIESKLGIVLNNKEEVMSYLNEKLFNKKSLFIEDKTLLNFSVRKQVYKLGQILKQKSHD